LNSFKTYILFSISLFVFGLSFGQENNRNEESQIKMTNSPYSLSWKKDGIIGGVGVGLRLTGEFLPQKSLLLDEDEANNFTSKDVIWFDRPAIDKFKPELINLSTSMNYFAFISPLPLFLSQPIRKDFLTIATMFIETRLYAEALPMITKKLFPRYRPYVFSEQFDYETKNGFNDSRSFFSSQSTYVFSSAVFTAKVFNDYFPENKARYWVWGGALTAALGINVLRHEIGIHYISDLVVGAAIGSALGFFIPHLHLKKSNKNGLSLGPSFHSGSFGLQLEYKL
jgi:membrane-associated phospholipid phosphatase